MNKIVLILGDLATGKSTFSHKLGQRYNCLVLNKDTIKECLGDAIGFKNREENKKLSNGTFLVMSYIFDMMSKTKQDIILESNFHKEELEKIYEQITKNNYQVLTCILSGDVDILYKRFMHRVTDENRHPVHVTDDLVEYESFKNYILKSRDVAPKGMTINIKADDFSYQNEENLSVFDNFFNK